MPLLKTFFASPFSLIAAILTMIIALPCAALDLNQTHQGDIVAVTLSDLRPTQAVVGFDPIFYKLGLFAKDKEAWFDEVCAVNGQKGVSTFDEFSRADKPDSYTCKQPVGSKPQDMKTVVIGPDRHLYLIDGHHSLNVFWETPEGGPGFPVHVIVAGDYRNLESMSAFWQALQLDKYTWLYDAEDNKISPEALPESLGLKNFTNDPYRGLIYFDAEISWDKPKNPVPFIEFYWAKEVRREMPLQHYDLNTMAGYEQAILDSSDLILHLDTDDMGGSGQSAKTLGRYKKKDKKALKKLLQDDSKLGIALRYKQQWQRTSH